MPPTTVFDYSSAPAQRLEDTLIALDQTSSYVFRDGTIIDGTGKRIRGSIVIRGDRIAEVTEDEVDVDDATVIDCRGKTVLPGMIDLEIHFLGWGHTNRFLGYLTPRPDLKIIRAGFEVYQTLAHGFTTVRSLGHGDTEHTFGLRQAIAEGLVRGPRIYHVGWALSPTRAGGTPLPEDIFRQLRSTLWAQVNGEQECRAMVRKNVADGAEVIKISFPPTTQPGDPAFSPAELEALVEESHRLGCRVAAHAKTVDAVRAAVLAGVDCIEHGPDVVDHDLLALMRDRGTYLVPTLAVYNRVLEVGDEFGYPQTLIDIVARELAGRRDNIAAARDAGITIALGSDAGARGGFGYLSAKELELLVDIGFTPMDAIVSATRHGAKVLGIDSDLGSLEVGKLAEIVIVDGDPLQDITLFQDASNIVAILQAADALTPNTYPQPAL